MSRDIFVQDLPPHATKPEEVPDDFVPKSIGTRTKVLEAIREIAPTADFSDPAWVTLDAEGFSIEFNLGVAETLQSFAMHIRGSDQGQETARRIVQRLGLRAIAIPPGVFW